MRRPTRFLLAGAIILLLGSAATLLQMYRKAAATRDDSVAREQTERAEYERASAAIADIRDSLDRLAVARPTLVRQSELPEVRPRTTAERRQEAMDRIAALDQRIRRDQTRIVSLESDLRRGGAHSATLAHTVLRLKRSVARDRATVRGLEDRVATMTARVADLESEVRSKNDALAARENALEERRHELATVYYIVGNRRDLMRAGVISASGGVLGLGRTLQLTDGIDESAFTALDTDQQRVIPIPAPRAMVLSGQSADSYELRPDGDQLTLAITDPHEFRKVRHVVIRVP